jgi:lysophospholipase L1-like esterase
MKNLFFLLGIFVTTLCFACKNDSIPANSPNIEYAGRIDFSNPLAPMFSYSGVSIRACFVGTGISMIMNDDTGENYYNLIVDGKVVDTLRISVGKKTYKIAEGLENKLHEIEIFKRTEQQFGKTQFFGFVVDKGITLKPLVNKRTRLIEYIGNSITCGYGNEGQNGEKFGPTTENHYVTYAAITSRNLNARHLAVCKSGIGIYRNYNGPVTGNDDCMTNFYPRIFLYDENPEYSFSEKPDLICINLGTNDFSTTGGDSARYVDNYLRLIDTLQTRYTNPEIVCLLGPMISEPTLAKIRRYINFIAKTATQKGKGNVYFFEMSQQTGDIGIGIDYHPSVAQHQRNAIELTEFIKKLKGW